MLQSSQENVEELQPGLALRVALMPRQHCHTQSHTALMVWQAARPLAQLMLRCPSFFQCAASFNSLESENHLLAKTSPHMLCSASRALYGQIVVTRSNLDGMLVRPKTLLAHSSLQWRPAMATPMSATPLNSCREDCPGAGVRGRGPGRGRGIPRRPPHRVHRWQCRRAAAAGPQPRALSQHTCRNSPAAVALPFALLCCNACRRGAMHFNGELTTLTHGICMRGQQFKISC